MPLAPRHPSKPPPKPILAPPPSEHSSDAAAVIPAAASAEETFTTSWLIERQREILAELARRQCESLAIYKPLPSQEGFHKVKPKIRLVRSGNRGGKTLTAAVEVARAVTNQDPHKKYPAKDGRIFLIGRDGKHLGDVMYRKLFRAGAFWIIKDQETGRWRSYLPNDPSDAARHREKKPAPPLIPPRFVQSISWYDKKANIPNVIRLTTGWELSFFSSQAKPARGSDIDLWWGDEELEDPEWIPEMQARVLDRGGCGFCSFTPESGTEQYYELHERALEEANESEPGVMEFVISLEGNTYVSDKDKAAFYKSLNEDQREVKFHGNYAVLGFKVYPEWNQTHWWDWFDIPRDWTRYAFVDPGRQFCATLFIAVPPHGKDEHVYVYEELYIRDCDARKWAKAFADKVRDTQLQAIWIDMHEARKFDTGSGRKIYDQYGRALKKQGVKAVETGYGFHAAPDDPQGGIEAVRGWLTEDEGGITRLRVLRGKAPNLDREMRHYHFSKVGGVVTDKPVKKRDHLADCLRYAASVDPPYRKPKAVRRTNTGLLAALARKKKMRRSKRRTGINLGPGD